MKRTLVENCVSAKFGDYTFYGHSRAAECTCFYIPELSLMLDAGMCCGKSIENILCTHQHPDHLDHLSYTIADAKKKMIVYMPDECVARAKALVDAMNNLADIKFSPHVWMVGIGDIDIYKHLIHSKYFRAVKLDHSAPTLGYIVYDRWEKTQTMGKLDIGILVAGKITPEITYTPLFAYFTDTHISAVEKIFESGSPAPTVFIECTFLDDAESANKKKHIDWPQLKVLCEKFPETHFVLIHFSTRYSDDEIKTFFAAETISNISLWLDSGVVHKK